LAAWFEKSAGRIPEDRRGNKTGAGNFLTLEIDALLRRHTRYKLTVGDKHPDPAKEFLTGCLELLGMRIEADSTIRKLPRCKVSPEKT
jgi:hypothetical protein